MDLYGGVGRRHTSKIATTLDSYLLSDNQQPHERHSSNHLLHPERKSSVKLSSQHEKSPHTGQSSFGQAVVNGVNLLCGVALLSTPYAMKEGGWFGLSILFIFCVLLFYTGILLRYCMDSQPGLKIYPDIGEAAFGIIRRLIISVKSLVTFQHDEDCMALVMDGSAALGLDLSFVTNVFLREAIWDKRYYRIMANPCNAREIL